MSHKVKSQEFNILFLFSLFQTKIIMMSHKIILMILSRISISEIFFYLVVEILKNHSVEYIHSVTAIFSKTLFGFSMHCFPAKRQYKITELEF